MTYFAVSADFHPAFLTAPWMTAGVCDLWSSPHSSSWELHNPLFMDWNLATAGTSSTDSHRELRRMLHRSVIGRFRAKEFDFYKVAFFCFFFFFFPFFFSFELVKFRKDLEDKMAKYRLNSKFISSSSAWNIYYYYYFKYPNRGPQYTKLPSHFCCKQMSTVTWPSLQEIGELSNFTASYWKIKYN